MNNSGKNENDILGKYINPERIEKAPERFTEKIMASIQVERAPSRMPDKIRLGVMVPVISATITMTLIALAIIFSSPADNTILSGMMKHFRNLDLTVPKISLDTISGLNLPGIIVYISIGFFILTLFDRALNNLFHRQGK